MKRRDVLAIGLGALSATALTPFFASAQGKYPERPIRLIVPFSAGGVVDVIGRLWVEAIKPHLGTFVIENQGGAGGVIGAGEVARSQPDGYTMLLGNTSTQVVNPLVMARPPYDPAKDFVTVSIIAISAIAIAVHPSVPAKTMPELIAHIKANPGKMSYGSPGAGTLTNLTGEIFKQLAKTPDLVHVPYKGAGPGITDLVSGHIPIMMLNITGQVLELHKTGKIRLVAVCTPKRLGVLPDVQAAQDTIPGLVGQLFTGLFVPAATPRDMIDRVAQANRAAMANDAFKKKLIESGFEPVLDTPAEAQRFVDGELAHLAPLIKSTGFKTQ
jgi:tripartite-type tricarboxylate transporter receptor subunit TctC